VAACIPGRFYHGKGRKVAAYTSGKGRKGGGISQGASTMKRGGKWRHTPLDALTMARGGKVVAYTPGRSTMARGGKERHIPLGASNMATSSSKLKPCYQAYIEAKICLKCAIFWKSRKNHRRIPPTPRWPPPSRVRFMLLQLFINARLYEKTFYNCLVENAPIFHLQTLLFFCWWWGRKNIIFPPGAGYPVASNYATDY